MLGTLSDVESSHTESGNFEKRNFVYPANETTKQINFAMIHMETHSEEMKFLIKTLVGLFHSFRLVWAGFCLLLIVAREAAHRWERCGGWGGREWSVLGAVLFANRLMTSD